VSRSYLTILTALFFVLAINVALAAPVFRGLPEKEAPAVIEGVYRAPRLGEVHFTSQRDGKDSAFLRMETGMVCALSRVEGDQACGRFASLDTKTRERSSCTFVFETGAKECNARVASRELEESSLFGVVKAVHRSRGSEDLSAE
jgi:hypothetical protein